MAVKRIGVLTSGGDSPGMNAAIRAVVRSGIYYGMEVYGIERGYNGLINGNCYPMDYRSVGDIINRGGTILYTARCEQFQTVEGRKKAAEQIEKNKLDGLVVIGGDGTFTGARILGAEHGIPVAGIPGTIDNDLPYTDFTLGFDTAVNTVLDAIRKIRDTMTSHDRISVLEVMGRASGQIAIYSGLCGGAECVIVPEIPWDINEVAQQVFRAHRNGKLGSLVVLTEGAGKGSVISEQIEKLTGIETKYTVLGHIQRGGSPSARDTQLACQFGEKAVSLLKSGLKNRVVGIRDNKIIDMDINEALAVKREMGRELYELTYILAK